MSQVIIDSKFVNYYKGGKGPVLLLLHGWGSSAKAFLPLFELFEKKYTVIAPDFPGFGESEAANEPWGIADMAQWVAAFCAKVDVTPTVLVGHSNGGAVAIWATAQQIITPKKLILLGCAGIRSKKSSKKQLFKLLAKAGKVATFPLPQAAKKSMRSKLYMASGSEMLDTPLLEATFKKVVAYDIRDDAGGVAIPTLLVYGENDTATPPKDGELLASVIKESELYIVPNAGHYVFTDATIKTYNLINEFLA